MARLRELAPLVEALRAARPDLDPALFAPLDQCLAEEVTTDDGALAQMQRLEQAFLPITRPNAHFEGSLEERIGAVSKALRDQNVVGKNGFLASIHPDHVVAGDPGERYYFDEESGSGGPQFHKVPYTVSADNHKVTFGDKEPVDLHMVAVACGTTVGANSGTTGSVIKMQADETAAGAADDEPEWLKQGLLPPGGDEDLVQTQSVLLQTESFDAKTGVLKIQGVATTGNVINSQKQVYPTDVWRDNLPHLQQAAKAGRLLGESDHPKDGRSTLERSCIKFTELWQDGNETKFKADILPTEPYGKTIITLIQNGVPVDISSRGKGRTVRGEWNGVKDVQIVQRGFLAKTFDCVIAGSSPGSTITDWQLQSAAANSTATEEEEEMKEAMERMAAIAESLAANQAKQDERMAALEQAATAKADAENKALEQVAADKAAAEKEEIVDPNIERTNKVLEVMEQAAVRGEIENLVQGLPARLGWGPQWVNVYAKQIKTMAPKTLVDLEQCAARAEELVQSLIEQSPKFPGHGFSVQKDKGDRGPKTVRELIDIMIADVPDDLPDDPHNILQARDDEGNPVIKGDFRTPRRALRKVLMNVANHVDEGWNGRAAAGALLMLAQGHSGQDAADWMDRELTQSAPDGYSAVGANGAPQSAPYIFPLIRRVYPQLFATEIASVQPLDKPDGKIFFLDFARKTVGTNYTDANGNTITDRTRNDNPAQFTSSYAADPGEGGTANFIQLKLSNLAVSVENKKLYAGWTLEEMQDLRAYHGLDAALELVGAMSQQVAMEWNLVVLNEMLAGATAGARTFNTTAPSGYTQKEWDEYISRYLVAGSNDIFKKRNGEYTHIIAGPDAWQHLAAAYRVGTVPNGFNPEQYAGITLNPIMVGAATNVKCYKTSLWGSQNTNSILLVRRGQDWSDTPYVWAPYMDTVTPILTTPEVFTQRQGILSRVAHKVVVGDAMATVTIASGTGVPL